MSESSGVRLQSSGRIHPEVATAIERTRDYLLGIQAEDGHWCGELEGDTILESEYILLRFFLGHGPDEKCRKAAEYIRRKQLPGGGWSIYPGGPPEVSASVKDYLVLKLLGDDPGAPHMRRAREAILGIGGIEACNSFTKMYLSVAGQYDWADCPAVPPEIILLPRWFTINIYEMSSWSRAIFVPLSIIWAHRPVRPLPPEADISELRATTVPRKDGSVWSSLFFGIDRCIKLVEKSPLIPSREMALKKAEEWILERLEGSDGLGAIFPPIVNTIMALRCLGYPEDHPTVRAQIRELEKLEIEEEETLRVQPCFSAAWDTALAMNALSESGVSPEDPALLRAAEWVLDRRGHGRGDWRHKSGARTRPGWFFEYANPFYPDNDTTAMVITALSKVRFPDSWADSRRRESMREAHEWHRSMQNRDGGWGAFDKNCDKEVLTQVPFADHNAMIDPSNEDITARVLECFAGLGLDRRDPAARRAVSYLFSHQQHDGSWFGRWGCNYIYGTFLCLWGLARIGEDLQAPWGRRAAAWLRSCQNEDGGWGELPDSYADPSLKGQGPSTPSQTAWALLGLMAGGELEDEDGAVERGVDYLLERQRPDGSWEEEHWTGTGFPQVFYLRYHLYATYFPLLTLATYRRLAAARDSETVLRAAGE